MSMNKSVIFYLDGILEAIDDIFQFTKDITFQDFRDDKKTYKATIRNFEIIGEAIKHLPLSIREEYSEIQWKEYAGLRDILIHQYFGVNLKIIWDSINPDLSILKEHIEQIMKNLKIEK